jgi:hypothetical protein
MIVDRLELASGAVMDLDEQCDAILHPDEVLSAICHGTAGHAAAHTNGAAAEEFYSCGVTVSVEGGKYSGQHGTITSVGASTCRLVIAGVKRTGNIKKRHLTQMQSSTRTTAGSAGAGATIGAAAAAAAVATAPIVTPVGATRVGYERLPQEVILLIFNYLRHYQDVSRARCTCTSWRDAAPLCNLLVHLQITIESMAPRNTLPVSAMKRFKSSDECQTGMFVEATFWGPAKYTGFRGTVLGIRPEDDNIDISEGDTVNVLIEETQQTVEFALFHLCPVPTVYGGALWRIGRFCDFIICCKLAPKSLRLVGNAAFKVIADLLLAKSIKSLFDCSKLETMNVSGCPIEWFADIDACSALKKLTVVGNKHTNSLYQAFHRTIYLFRFDVKFNGPMENLTYLYLGAVRITPDIFCKGTFPALKDLRLEDICGEGENKGVTWKSTTNAAQKATTVCTSLESLFISEKATEASMMNGNTRFRLPAPNLRALVLKGKGFRICFQDQDAPKLELFDAQGHYTSGRCWKRVEGGEQHWECQHCEDAPPLESLQWSTNCVDALDKWIDNRRL